ncbi:hypothetical protein PbB2_00193 [Candidatus Phycosocius bacilliformis]|uniref:Stringent starvation protein B n=1 Tax=Candidatus Phycosocius bacilliformis TaxID=1445552 RepID=A0A2P2E645_9PROT|nr:ClpXP protease specificity-enhancing factor SspB [Candidatus Phycosocius bacilliformis]GBF56536.1 hypothetical protein PbB2_00193 [Candidatus Phycosocius bacilliformis]
MSEDLIGYAKLTQDALRGVVRDALKVALTGLPGDHHFYISFRTRSRGVQVAQYLAAKYPDEMTIVIQHQYEGLEVRDDHFAITLHFGGVPQRIVIPFAAITRFYDPSVRFALPFDAVDDLSPDAIEEEDDVLENDVDGSVVKAPTTGAVVSLDAFRRKK